MAGRGWRVLAGSPGFLIRQLLCRARLTARGQVRSRRVGMSSRAIWARWVGPVSPVGRGNVRRPGGDAADQAQGLGEGDRVRVEVGGGGSHGQRADRVVHDQVRPDLLIGQVLPAADLLR